MAFTKITAAGIGSTETVTLDGVAVINNESIGGNLTVTGNATIGGVLTYEDVTNVDSVGVITARAGVLVGSGITLSKDGDIFATGVTTSTTFSGSGANLTNLPAANLTGTLPAISGANLTGVAGTENIRTNTNATFLQNINVSGTSTVAGTSTLGRVVGTSFTTTGPTGQTAFVNQHAVGVGSTTTTGKFAGVGTDAGTIVFDVTKTTLEYFNGSLWIPTSSSVPSLTSVTGNIIASNASTITLAGEGFGAANLVVNFVQSSDGINENVTVTPSSGSGASVAVPADVYNDVTAGNAVTIKVTNSEGLVSNTVTHTAIALPSGGSVTTSGNYRIHSFTSSGTFVNTISSLSVQYLVIAGGGAGGVGDAGAAAYGGGGGAGGYRTNVTGQTSGASSSAEAALTISTGNKTVTVGAGGAGTSGDNNLGTNGGDSVFDSITSIGGGRGGANSADGSSGGSGGGGKESDGAGQSGTAGQGTAGGSGSEGGNRGGGGGGAAVAGGTTVGGDGLSNNITGSAVTRAGGGGSSGSGGTGGGGAGGNPTGGAASGSTGSGGGAGTQNSGNGGSGIVIVRYLVTGL